jgi:CubicO group peptidase (beta-lactamase class C family)
MYVASDRRPVRNRRFGLKARGAAMNSISVSFLSAVLVCVSLSSTPAASQERPVSGRKAPGFEPTDTAVLSFMDTIGCQAATVAVSRDGRLLYSRGYGWSDEAGKRPVPADALMRIASVTKPITAAAVRNAIRAKQLSLDTKAFEFIAVKVHGGKVADPRIGRVTVGQLLEHKGGTARRHSIRCSRQGGSRRNSRCAARPPRLT